MSPKTRPLRVRLPIIKRELNLPGWEATGRLVFWTSLPIITLWAVGPVWTWLGVATFSAYFTFKNTRRSWVVRQDRLYDPKSPDAEKFLSSKRFEQELVLSGVVLSLWFAGLAAAFAGPSGREVITVASQLLPLLLILAHIGIALHSWMVHYHHHKVVSILSAELLKKQHLQRRLTREQEARS